MNSLETNSSIDKKTKQKKKTFKNEIKKENKLLKRVFIFIIIPLLIYCLFRNCGDEYELVNYRTITRGETKADTNFIIVPDVKKFSDNGYSVKEAELQFPQFYNKKHNVYDIDKDDQGGHLLCAVVYEEIENHTAEKTLLATIYIVSTMYDAPGVFDLWFSEIHYDVKNKKNETDLPVFEIEIK